MTEEQRKKNLSVPCGIVDAVLDTDAFNEIDDQFAIAYFLRSPERIRPVALYAAPFLNAKSYSPCDGMKKSHKEILHILSLADKNEIRPPVFFGSETYLPSEKEAVDSPSARDLVKRALSYSPEAPLYVISIGAITNIASALLLAPEIRDRIVIVWLGGNARHWKDTREFNMSQDIAAARVVMTSGAPFVQLPCQGVVSAFTTTGPELEYRLVSRTPLSDYLAKNTIREAESYSAGRVWSRVIWDVTAVAWLLNDNDRFLSSQIESMLIPDYQSVYEPFPDGNTMRYIYAVNRDALMGDLFKKLIEK